jgi:alkylated DNA repair protein (DNA oxidative demethylase)
MSAKTAPEGDRADRPDPHIAAARGIAVGGSGLRVVPGYFERPAQEELLAALREAIRAAPLYTPTMPKSGRPLSVRMTNCGPLGWMTDAGGYRYQEHHPETGAPWPPIPDLLLAAWRDLSGYPHAPEACLVNFYGPAARMGLHQDRDEADMAAPVLSLSLGDTCLFRIGGTHRDDPTRTLRLASGDAVVLGGDARLAFHGVDRIIPGTSTLLGEGGRINLTLRRVTLPPP